MNTITSFFIGILTFLHVISPTPLPTPVTSPSPTPIVSQQPSVSPKPTQKPVTDSSKVSACKLEAALATDKLSEVFIKSSESQLSNNPLYREYQLIQKAKLQKLTTYEVGVFSTAYKRNIVEHRIPAELDALLKVISNELINSQKELQDSFNLLVAQQSNLAYLRCINR